MHNRYYTLITGASMGFGKALALECARRNMNLILVALPREGLPQLAGAIHAAYSVEAVAIEKDLCEPESCNALLCEVVALGLQVNMLINNAGIGSTELFEEGCILKYEKQIRLNVLATTMITRLFIGILKQNSPSYVLNVGSLASFFSLPKKQVYGATKSFICYFSKSLRRELIKDKVFVSVLCPGGMFTNPALRQVIATGNYLSRTTSMEPEDVAPVAIKGLLQKREVIIPGKINRTIVFLNGFLPRFIVRFFEERTMKRLHTQPAEAESKKNEHVPVQTLSCPPAEKFLTSK